MKNLCASLVLSLAAFSASADTVIVNPPIVVDGVEQPAPAVHGFGLLNYFYQVPTDHDGVTALITASSGYNVTLSDQPNVSCMGPGVGNNVPVALPCYDMTGVVFAPGYPQPSPLGYSITFTMDEYSITVRPKACSGRGGCAPRTSWYLNTATVERP